MSSDIASTSLRANGAQAANSEIEAEKSERRRQRIGPTGNINDRRGMHGMNGPGERGEERDVSPFPFLDSEKSQQLTREKEQGERRGEV